MKRLFTILSSLIIYFVMLTPSIEAKHHKHKSRHDHRIEKIAKRSKHHHGHKHHRKHHPRHHHGHHPRRIYYYEPTPVVRVSRDETGLIPLVGFSLGPVVNATVNMPVPVTHTRTVIVDRDYDDYDDDDDYYWGRLGVYESSWPSSIISFQL